METKWMEMMSMVCPGLLWWLLWLPQPAPPRQVTVAAPLLWLYYYHHHLPWLSMCKKKETQTHLKDGVSGMVGLMEWHWSTSIKAVS